MYLHCPNCQATVSAAHLAGPSPACPRCGAPATEPLSLFASMPSRYRKGIARRAAVPRDPIPGARGEQSPTPPAHR